MTCVMHKVDVLTDLPKLQFVNKTFVVWLLHLQPVGNNKPSALVFEMITISRGRRWFFHIVCRLMRKKNLTFQNKAVTVKGSGYFPKALQITIQIEITSRQRLPVNTVEDGSLHTFRLESLKLVFQPLHKLLVNKLWFWQVG